MNFFYMKSDGTIINCPKRNEFYVSGVGSEYLRDQYSYDEKISDICYWLANNAREFALGICFGMEHGCAVEFKYEIFILDDDDAIQFKLIWA